MAHNFEYSNALLQVRRAEMESEQKRHDELKRQAEAAKEEERSAKYQLALAREEERKMVGSRDSEAAAWE